VVLIIAAGVGIYLTSSSLSSGFVPDEDRGIIFANIELPAGSSIDRTAEVNEELYNKVSKLPGVRGASMIQGFSLINGQGSNYGLGFVALDDWENREADSLSVETLTKQLFGIGASIPEANIVFFSPPSIPGFGASSGFEVNLLDRSGGSFKELDQAKQQFIGKLMQEPAVQYAQSSFNTNYPQYELSINVPQAKESGISINDIFTTLQGYIGGVYTSNFTRFGKQYRVYVQSLPEDRKSEESLGSIKVRTGSGEMAPITQFIDLKKVYGPQSVTRFNLFNSAKLSGAANPGFSSGDAIAAVQRTAEKLPKKYDIAYSGLTREEVSAGSQTTTIFLLSLVFVYFLLAAQYESYLLPFSVLLSLPFGVFGAYITTALAGLQDNIYFQIALVMLLGLLAKNAILIVEFAIIRRKEGESIVDSAIDGAKVRLRPILMTSFAFILGMMPLVLATGVGAEGNRSIGTGAAGGLLIGTIFGVFVIPLLYIAFQYLQEKVGGKPDALEEKKS
jgi:HAE1 family hydrophobic/amphiphilic exporter-1